MSKKFDNEYFMNAISFVDQILKGLKVEDAQKKLKSIKKLSELSEIPKDDESRQLKIYKETVETYKRMYVEVARAIMYVLDSNYSGLHDESESYNYAPPKEPVAAVEAIKLLPNAYIGGPIKSAINTNNQFIQKIAIDYFESLPIDIRISNIFPDGYSVLIKKLKSKITN